MNYFVVVLKRNFFLINKRIMNKEDLQIKYMPIKISRERKKSVLREGWKIFDPLVIQEGYQTNKR